MKYRQDTGSALVMAVFVLALLSATGIALMFMSRTEVRASEADMRSKQVYYLAEAGMEAGRATLLILNGAGPFSDDLATYAGVDGALDFDPDSLQATYDSDGDVTGLTGYGDDVPLINPTVFGDGWYAAFMTNDAVNGTSPNDTNDRVVITGIGMSANNSIEIVQAVILRDVVIPPAAITLLGPTPSFVGGQSNPKEYVGEDCDGVGGVPNLFAPIVGVVDAAAEALVESGIGSDTAYNSGPYVGEDTFADLSDPTESTYGGPMDPIWTDCQELHDLVEKIRTSADVVCTNGSSCTLPTPAPDNVIFVDDDYHINADGAGLLLVTGALTTNGGVVWSGMLWAIGTGEYQRSGGGTGEISGSIMVADIAGPDGVYGNSDDCTGGVGGFGIATFDENGGGTGTTMYCTDDIMNALPALPYELDEFRQY
jgi:hypothetical protein